MATTNTPKVRASCVNSRCDEFDKPKEVDAGVVVGDNVLLTGQLSCMVCGSSCLIEATPRT